MFLGLVPVSVLETVGEKLFDCMIIKASIIHFPRIKRTKTSWSWQLFEIYLFRSQSLGRVFP